MKTKSDSICFRCILEGYRSHEMKERKRTQNENEQTIIEIIRFKISIIHLFLRLSRVCLNIFLLIFGPFFLSSSLVVVEYLH